MKTKTTIKRMACTALAVLTAIGATLSVSAATYDSCYTSYTYNGTLCDGSGVHKAVTYQNYKSFEMSTSSTARYGGAGVNVPLIYIEWQKTHTGTPNKLGSLLDYTLNNASSVSDNDIIPLSYSITNTATHFIGISDVDGYYYLKNITITNC